MSTEQPLNELFFPKLEEGKKGDPLFEAACGKVENKLKKYALSRGIDPDELRLFDVCDAEGELHPKLRLFIEKTPRLAKQTVERHKKYKEEICANAQRAIDGVVALVTGGVNEGSSDGGKTQMPALLRHNEHQVLKELYEVLPREPIVPSPGSRFRRGTKITENGRLFYLSCAEALEHCSASSLHQFLNEYRPALYKTFKITCECMPEKINSLIGLIREMCKKVGVKIPPKRKIIPVEEWPSPIREEMQTYQAAAKGILMPGLEEKLARADVKISIADSLRATSAHDVEVTVERLIHRYCLERGRLSVRDLLATTESEVLKADGKKRFEYYNPVLSPYRESERARADDYKRAGYDSESFKHTVTDLLSLAAYNGIFEYHEIVRKAFKIKKDVERIGQRKAEKKSVIKRKTLDEWLEDNRPEYERILTQGLFKRDKSKRKHTEADRNMRFVLFYCRLGTMKVMGYRQRQLRDCVYGVNLVVTPDSLEFTFPSDKTKKAKPLRFKAESDSGGKTHGQLIDTLYLFHKYGFPYVQNNLISWPATKGNQGIDSRGQFFVHLSRSGKFIAFDPTDSSEFGHFFKTDCSSFLKHPKLKKEAVRLIHPHYVRGAAMDTQIEDNGMSMEAASRYFGATEQVIRSKYKDKKATQDASRDVILLNAQIEDLEERKKRNRDAVSGTGTAKASDAEVQELRRQLRESQDRESEKAKRIAKLEERLDRMQASQDMRHDEIMEALHRGGNGRAARKGRSKTKPVHITSE
jgi:hypothetical protein